MKIQKLKFENVGLLTGNFDIKDDIIVVSGLNQSGKTTFCRAFDMICNSAMPADIIAKGFDQAKCQISLTDGTVIDWSQATDKKPAVKIIYPDGKKVKATKDILSGFSAAKFNINEFAQLTPKAKKEAIAKMSGIDLDKFNNAEKLAEDDRQYWNRSVKTTEAQLQGLDISLADESPVDVSELQKLLEAANSAISVQDKQTHAVEVLTEKQQRIANEINSLTEKLKELKKENGKVIQDLQRGQETIKAHKDFSGEKQRLQKAITTASETNLAISKAKESKQKLSELQDLREKAETADAKVQEIRNERIEALKQVQLPADMRIADDGQGLLFIDNNGNEISIESANEAQKVITSLKVALHNIGSVKALSVDVSLLDKTNRQYVFDWATENDIQLFAERVSDDDQLQVEFID